ncbi:MAG: ATP-binding cassette domain-containing protein [Nitrospira sp.]|nr:ATP-binding cassette domain-containing protein [Nitrospira sp.]
MIQLFHVSKFYDRCTALDDVSFRIDKGECVILTGPSGAGKTTLLKVIFGAEIPDSGQILVQNRNVARLRGGAIPYLRRTMGIVLQNFQLLPRKTVYENVILPLVIQGVTRRLARKQVLGVLKAVGMDHKQTIHTGVLSAGEQQRICIARAIVNSPILLLADEPTGNLDAELTVEIVELFKRIHAEGTTILLATHNQRVVEQMNGRVVHLQAGRVVSDDGATS